MARQRLECVELAPAFPDAVEIASGHNQYIRRTGVGLTGSIQSLRDLAHFGGRLGFEAESRLWASRAIAVRRWSSFSLNSASFCFHLAT